MREELIFHRTGGNYAYITGENEAEILLEVGKGDFQKVELIYFDQYLVHGTAYTAEKKEMIEVAETKYLMYYRLKINPPCNRLGYYFKLTTQDGQIYYYNEMGCVTHASPKDLKSFLISYLNQEDQVSVPSWARESVCYQIFPDAYSTEVGAVSDAPYNSQYAFKGGTLKGITSRLDYLKDLGIDAIYMTPIFKANTVHRYETVDYREIDPRLGTKEDFKTLVDAAHQRGIRIILDAVFNHTSSYFFAFEDILTHQEKSKYKDWYFINQFPISREDISLRYETFATVRDMPKFNTRHKEVEQYLLDVVTYWTKEYKIDGWRLDVANEVGLTFWRKFREVVKTINPEAIIIGESWNDSNRYLQGDTFDSVMNYPLRTWMFGLLTRYCSDRSLDQYKINSTQFKHQYGEFMVRYPKPIFDGLMNLIDSHDIPRIRQLFTDEKIVHLLTVMQLTLSGFPCIYYGNEVGLGYHSEIKSPEEGRITMKWDETQNKEILEVHKQLISLRKIHKSLSCGDLQFIDTNNEDVLAYVKKIKDEMVLVVLNLSHHTQAYEINDCSLENSKQLYGEMIQKSDVLPPFGVGMLML